MSMTIGSLAGSLNILSVLHRPMPIAPNFNASCASFGVSAFAITLSMALSSARARRVLSSDENSASMSGTSPR
ncbi:MAG: hypothetical protein BWY05_01380 [Euryarchaeota archaeon ADurb.Bin165]|nr:MAG: hypothetical protein BWY05_01380 [Euryarchaeota archaeon ADurb.Bin165]